MRPPRPAIFRLTTFRIALTSNPRRPPPFRFTAFNHSSPFDQVCRILHIRRLVQARNPAQCYTHQNDLLSNVRAYLRIEEKSDRAESGGLPFSTFFPRHGDHVARQLFAPRSQNKSASVQSITILLSDKSDAALLPFEKSWSHGMGAEKNQGLTCKASGILKLPQPMRMLANQPRNMNMIVCVNSNSSRSRSLVLFWVCRR